MTGKIQLLPVILFALLPVTGFTQEGGLSSILEEGSQLEKLAGDFSFTEGPAADKAGNVYFTDQPNDRIMVWSVDGNFRHSCSHQDGRTGCFLTRKAICGRAPTRTMNSG